MALQTATLNKTINMGGLTIQISETQQEEGLIVREVEVAAAANELEIDFAVPLAQLKAFAMISDQALLVETNNATTPDDTFNLVSNQGVGFAGTEQSIITVDLTKLYLSNAGGTEANFKVVALFDPTP